MNKNITYNGLSAIPDDYQAQDGLLDISLNLIHEDDHLRPIHQPQTLFTINAGETIACIHKTSEFTHYITIDAGNVIAYRDSNDISTSHTILTPIRVVSDNEKESDKIKSPIGTVSSITPMGNTLVCLTSNGIAYLLWKPDSNNYLYIPGQWPSVKLSFGLQCQIKSSNKFSVTFKGNTQSTRGGILPQPSTDGIRTLTSSVLAKVNAIINDEVLGSNRFCMPFFVRYAYRLYDGTLTCQSAPILMLPTTGVSPLVLTKNENSYSDNEAVSTINDITMSFRVYTPACKLDVACTQLDNISAFSDIIKSIDIFISAPIYSYDQSGECKDFEWYNDTSFGYFAMDNIDDKYSDNASLLATLKKYSRWTISSAIRAETGEYNPIQLKLPTKGEGAINSAIAECANFYLLTSIPISELSSTRTILNIDEGSLNALLSHETLPDDYDSHDRLMPKLSFVYNSRLNIANIQKELFNGYFSMPYVNGYILPQFPVGDGLAVAATDYTNSICHITNAFVHIKRDGKTFILKENPNITLSARATTNEFLRVPFYYHPDPYAFQVDMFCEYGGNTYKLTLPLQRHQNLNGAFYFDSFATQTLTQVSSVNITESSNKYIYLQNKLYTSEVNNPFFFNVTGINTIGTGSIIGLSAAVKALSQGQFGQFPLYAFCTDGVWALETSSTGSFSAKQPITRDVCTNPDSITQLDDSVLFVTDRGLLLLAGSSTSCLSDIIATDHPLSIASLPKLSTKSSLSIAPFSEYITSARIIYDYIHQHLILYNPSSTKTITGYITTGGEVIGYTQDGQVILSEIISEPIYSYSVQYPYAYVFSLKSKRWGMMSSNILYHLNSYPDAIAATADNPSKVITFSNPTSAGSVECLLVTRPLKLGNPDTLNSIYTIIQRGMFKPGDIAIVLYGSRDLYSWHLIASANTESIRNLQGSPYRYFRIAVIATLSDDKSLAGVTIEFKPRHTNILL